MPEKVPKLREARTSEQILTAAAAYARYARDPGATGPYDTPGALDLAEWWGRESRPAGAAANNLLAETLREGRREWGMLRRPRVVLDDEPLCAVSPIADLTDTTGREHYTVFKASPLEFVHERWLEHGFRRRAVHPIVPLVDGWQRRSRDGLEFRPKQRASLPRLHRITAVEVASLPPLLSPFDVNDTAEVHLPVFTPTEGHGCPPWLLSLYDRAGGRVLHQGIGAPWDLRLLVGVFLHLHLHGRDGWTRIMAFPSRYVESWIHPDGWSNRRRDWWRFPEALGRLATLSQIHIPGHGRFGLVWASGIPATPSDATVEFHARVPPSAGPGARLSWYWLCRYGAESASLYRAYLAAVTHLDRCAVRGHPITAEIGAPVVGENGRPKRRRGGAQVRDWTVLVANPLARFVPTLDGADLAGMMGFDPTNRVMRFRARQAFQRLARDGVVELRETGPRHARRYQLFGPRSDSQSQCAE